MPGDPFYHLEITAGGCALLVLLNGFPIFSQICDGVMIEAPPVNPYLVGLGNSLVLEASAAPGVTLEAGDLRSVTLVVKMKAFAPGDVVAPESGEVIAVYDLAAAPPESRTGLPLTAALTFDTRGPSFRGLLLEGPALPSEEAVRDYALRLRDLLRSQSLAELKFEFAPKLRDYVAAYAMGDVDAPGAFAAFLSSEFLPAGPVLDFDRSELLIRPWCGGRIAEVTLGGRELLATPPDAEGAQYTLPVFVGQVDGQLRVVR